VSSDAGTPSRSRGARIAAAVLAFYTFLIASLLVFPAWLPVMAGGWLALAALRHFRKRPAWPILALCLALILIKRVDWGLGIGMLLIALAAAAAVDGLSRRKPALAGGVRPALAAVFAVWILSALLWERSAHTSRRPAPRFDRPVVCLGDSLLSGGFARVLQQRLKVPVVDLAQGGITTAEGLKRIPEMVASRPQAVLVELGGHDSLRGRSRAEARANLEKIIDAARGAGAEVFLFEIPLGFVSDPYGGLHRELARVHDLELISDGAIRQLVYFSPFTPLGSWSGRLLSYDGLHPNEAGNAFLADRAEAALARVYGGALQR
jgi:acyl-CoA thioesterase-1